MSDNWTLEGVNVVVTRPQGQAETLCRMIEERGGSALRFPVLEILDPPAAITQRANALLQQLESFDLAIFVSPNAVIKAAQRITSALPTTLKLAAVGKSTAQALHAVWQHPVLIPERNYSSEGLLALEQMQQVEGWKIIIFRGQGGRELLAQTLAQRGATVEHVELYRRAIPQGEVATLRQYQPSVDAIIVTSNAGLKNLHSMACHREEQIWLQQQPLVVISERTANLAVELGFRQRAIVAPEASDVGLMAALKGLTDNLRVSKST